MNLEQLKNLDKKYAQAIANELLKRIETDDCLKNKLVETTKTLKGCISYIKSEAQKEAQDGCAVMTDEDVYQLAQHYFLEDSIDFEPKAKPVKENKKPAANADADTDGEDTDTDDSGADLDKEPTPDVKDDEHVSAEESKPVIEAKKKKAVKQKFEAEMDLFDL